jgi:hypothetical protein
MVVKSGTQSGYYYFVQPKITLALSLVHISHYLLVQHDITPVLIFVVYRTITFSYHISIPHEMLYLATANVTHALASGSDSLESR